ncbi:hypothetical protein HMPREF0262_02393 [Clostridium sp. ATCC 29733]|nr:hypothetical protein HMPREF0262_02393 [Clostridium sp. ATCC 29733]
MYTPFPFLSRPNRRQGRWPHIRGAKPDTSSHASRCGYRLPPARDPPRHPQIDPPIPTFPHLTCPPSASLCADLQAHVCDWDALLPPTPRSAPRFTTPTSACFRCKTPPAQRGWDSCGSNRYAPSHSSPFCRPPFAPLADRAFTASKGMSTPSPSPALFQRSRHNWGFLLQKNKRLPKEPPVSQFSSQSGETQRVLPQRGRVTSLSGPPISSAPLPHLLQKGVVGGGGAPEPRGAQVTASPPLSPSPPTPTAEPPAGRGFATPASRAGGSAHPPP